MLNKQNSTFAQYFQTFKLALSLEQTHELLYRSFVEYYFASKTQTEQSELNSNLETFIISNILENIYLLKTSRNIYHITTYHM